MGETFSDIQNTQPTIPGGFDSSPSGRHISEKRLKPWQRFVAGAGLCAAAGLGGVGIYELSEPEGYSVSDIADIGITLHPPVSDSGSRFLIGLNDGLEDVGTYVLGAGLLLGAGASAYKRSKRGLEIRSIDAQTKKRPGIVNTAIQRGLPPVIIGFAASSVVLGGVAAEGASKPVDEVISALGVDGDTNVVVQYEGYVPFSHGALDYRGLHDTSEADGAKLVPLRFHLGVASNPRLATNPSSVPITAIPNAAMNSAFNVDLGPINNCDDLEVVVSSQLEALPGESIVVNGRKATVAKTADIYPGLDRVAVFTSTEQADKCLFKDVPYSAAIIQGGSDKPAKDLQQELNLDGINFEVTSLDQLKSSYEYFWDRSVKPPEMQQLALLFMLGAAAASFMSLVGFESNRRQFAGLLANQVSPALIRASLLERALADANLAVPFGAVMTLGLTAMTNSSQFGLEAPADIRSLGAGYTVYLAARALGMLSEVGALRSVNVSQEIRGNQ